MSEQKRVVVRLGADAEKACRQYAKQKQITVGEAADKLISTGVNRLAALRKWTKKVAAENGATPAKKANGAKKAAAKGGAKAKPAKKAPRAKAPARAVELDDVENDGLGPDESEAALDPDDDDE